MKIRPHSPPRLLLHARLVSASLLFLAAGCARPSSPTTHAAAVNGQSHHIHSDKGEIDFDQPPAWKSVDKGGDFVAAFVPEKMFGDETILAVQVPTLPPHIPGFLPLGGVADGYVKDLTKRFPDQKVDERSVTKLDGADARHIVSSFQKDGKSFREVALLSVHGDHVYVITATCPATQFDQSQSAFNQLTSSWKWKS